MAGNHILGVIPARYASVRLPAKPLVDLCGKPMVQRVYEQAKKSTLLTRVVVATDHEAIVQTVQAFGGEVILTSPELKSGSDRVAAVAKEFPDAEIIVNIQGDEPLIAPGMIDEAIQPLLDNDTVRMGTIIRKIESSEDLHNPNIVKVTIDENMFALYFSRSPIPFVRDLADTGSWHLHHAFYKHFGLYVYRRELLIEYCSWKESPLEKAEKLEQLRVLERGYKIITAITEYDSIPIDTADDAERVRSILTRQEGNTND